MKNPYFPLTLTITFIESVTNQAVLTIRRKVRCTDEQRSINISHEKAWHLGDHSFIVQATLRGSRKYPVTHAPAITIRPDRQHFEPEWSVSKYIPFVHEPYSSSCALKDVGPATGMVIADAFDHAMENDVLPERDDLMGESMRYPHPMRNCHAYGA